MSNTDRFVPYDIIINWNFVICKLKGGRKKQDLVIISGTEINTKIRWLCNNVKEEVKDFLVSV